MNSVLSYPFRGPYGDAKYRGNCSGYIIKDLLEHYRPKNFLECFAGSGTGYDVARELGYENSIHLDLNDRFGQFNLLTDTIPAGADFVFSHPPYWNIVKYSGIKNVWGNQPHKDDLSHINDYSEFVDKLNLINKKIFKSIQSYGRHAILIGDIRRNGKYYSIIKDMKWYGDLEAHLIKIQHNTLSQNKRYSNNNFIPIAHEHLLVFRKTPDYL
ncbi:DNA modification methylase [Virgibacillus sp. 179-BFC.A HS]|uniref:DNA modification methylase n=1 Tax=Tigheibacillus jepli TaxID=3035914 RepID=A0ABU5CF90_9BACI|nr:DNA modification methylase [Virgibacillus sp. 179-BFC.A HS]MDY0404666.1 DNA modification methylase [Virgibacillus sp. 179-BFC.A HS]